MSAPGTYGAPSEVANRIREWLGKYAKENTASLLLYEALKALEGVQAAAQAPTVVDNFPWREIGADGVVRVITESPTAQPCQRCSGSRVVDDGEITGVGGVEFNNGPIKCVKDCPDCAAHSADARNGEGVALLQQAIEICDAEGREWDSDNLITEKNYAHACRDRIRALLAAPAAPAPMEMALCEQAHLILKPGQLYRFTAIEGCEQCALLAIGSEKVSKTLPVGTISAAPAPAAQADTGRAARIACGMEPIGSSGDHFSGGNQELPSETMARIRQQSATPAASFREALATLIDIYDDARNNPPESRCYVDGAFSEEMDAARALIEGATDQCFDCNATLRKGEVCGCATPADAASEADKRDWQPIDTAPKTGRTLLLGYHNSAGNWRTVRGQWMSEAYIHDNWDDPDSGVVGWYETSAEADEAPSAWYINPTHWMPTPAEPCAFVQRERQQGAQSNG